jgi:N-acetylneuraminate synthase
MATVKIGDRLVGDDQPPLVIPEIGINHEGEFEKAIQLVDAAVASGAECVKFQCHIAEMEMIETDIRHEGVSTEREWDIVKRCELSESEEIELKRYCEEKGLLYLCTPFSREAADRLETMDLLAFKIGSGECNNIPLLQHVARKGRPIILSTGANDLASVRASVETILALDCPLVLLHCTSAYPTPYELVRLGAIAQLRDEFGVPVGLSDHSMGIYAALGAVALGACVVEKHFTISRDWPGPDIPISIEPDELRELVVGAQAVYEARGGSKTLLSIEQPVIDFAYASVVTIAAVAAGEVLSSDNVWVKRPGTGAILAKDLDLVLGRVARHALPAGKQLSPDDFAPGPSR